MDARLTATERVGVHEYAFPAGSRAQVVVDTLSGTDQPGTFDIDGLLKDLTLALALAKLDGADLPVARASDQRYRAAQAAGLGRFDGASLTRLAAKR